MKMLRSKIATTALMGLLALGASACSSGAATDTGASEATSEVGGAATDAAGTATEMGTEMSTEG